MNQKIGFIGGGNMGSAMMAGSVKNGVKHPRSSFWQ